MGSKTISLEDSAFERLRAAKRPGESYSDVVHRLVAREAPSLLDLAGLVSPAEGRRLKSVVARMRREDVASQRHAKTARGKPRGR
ncbi:MAG: antitoxin VapB family protein [Thermoplasmatota archaeon]